jgi:DNA-binding transcriptional regulator YdaS (Cro superfamily)
MEQRDVAALVGCSEAQVSRIVSGEQAGSPSLRLAIVRAITARLEDMAGSPA